MSVENEFKNSGSGQSNRANFNKKRTSLNNLVSGLGKLRPQALDLEEAVLGALMLEKNALSQVTDILKPQCSYKGSHQTIFQAIHPLVQKPSPIALLAVVAALRQRGDLEIVGGAYYITQ